MKRVGNLWEKIVDYDNLVLAHKMARKDKTFYREVKMVDENEEYYLREIQRMLVDKTYVVSEYRLKIINDKGKERKLMKLQYFPDRIIQWAILIQLEPTFLKTFCNHTCASIPGRGNHRVQKLMKRYLEDEYNTKYCLQIDIKKFYESLDHDILKSMLRRKIKDKDLLWILDLIIDSYPNEKGVPIGSYLSQYLANFYLSEADHLLKEKYHAKYVIRYMDDIVVFGRNKEILHSIYSRLKTYVESIGLEIKGNWQIYRVNIRGVAFVGYRYFRRFTLLSKKTARRLKEVCERILRKGKNIICLRDFCAINSYIGLIKVADTRRLITKYIHPIVNAMLRYYWYCIARKKAEKIKAFNRYRKKFFHNIGYVA